MTLLLGWLQAEPSRVRQQLIAEGLELEEVGGSVQVVETAATQGQGLLALEEALMLQVAPRPCRSHMNHLPHHTVLPHACQPIVSTQVAEIRTI